MVVDTAAPWGVRNPTSSSPTPEQYRKEGFFRDKPPGSGTTSHTAIFRLYHSNSRKRMMAAEEQTHSHSVNSKPAIFVLFEDRKKK